MANIHDVARAAGVSIATVSRHLAGQRIRSTAAVDRAIAELDFRPNTSARGLRLGRHNTVAAIVPDISNPYFAQIVRGLEETIAPAGLRVVVGSSNEDADTEVQLLNRLSDAVDAFVLVPAIESDATKLALERIALPTVLVDRVLHEESAFDVVVVDNAAGAELAARHLAGLGHTLLAIISGPQTSLPGRIRHEQFVAAAAEANVEIPERFRKIGQFTQDFGYEATRELLAEPERPTAIFVGNNLMAHGALKALNEAHIAVPAELSMLSFDDFALAELLNPPHSVISRPAGLEGQIAGERILHRLAQPDAPAVKRILPVSLTLRASTAPPPRTAP